MLLIAGGFVLGEVLILLHILKVWQIAGILLLVGLIPVWLRFAAVDRDKQRESRSARLWLLLFCTCIFAGAERANIVGRQTEAAEAAVAAAAADREAMLSGRIRQIEVNDKYVNLELEQGRIYKNGSEAKVQGILVSWDRNEAPDLLKIGMGISVEGRMEEFALPRNPGEFHSRNYYRSRQLNGRLRGKRFSVTDSNYSRLREGLYQIRCKGGDILGELVKEPQSGIFQAAILGDKTGLDSEIKTLYGRNGISHLLALSGLHLSLVSAVVYQGLRRCGAGFFASGIAAAVLTGVYVLMTGSPVSVVRAAIMLVCSFFAAYCGRRYDLLSALGLALVFLLWDCPYLLFQSGFQLSFGAVTGIGAVAPYLCSKKSGSMRQAVSMGIAVQSVTLPMVLFHFYQTSLYGIILNLIVIPLMGFVIASGIAGIFLGMLHVSLGRFAVGAGVCVLVFYEQLCTAAEHLPYSVWITGQPEIWQLISYAIALLISLLVWQKQGKKKDKKRNYTFRFFYLMALQLLFFIPVPVFGVQVTFLDVGQGDGICIRSGYHTILADAGSSNIASLGKYRLEPYLKQQGISTIDYVYVSHGDNDHISGILYLLKEGREIQIKNLMLPAAGRGAPVYETLSDLVLERGGDVHWIGAGDVIELGGLKISCLYPGKDEQISDLNSHSLVLKADYQAFHLLLTGDMGEPEETRILSEPGIQKELSDIQVLKVAHHGSRFSTSKAWLSELPLRWAVVSYGASNTYGHPHKETLERLKEQAVTLFRTGEGGAVTLYTDGKNIQWDVYLQP